jgi:hypothetical protein
MKKIFFVITMAAVFLSLSFLSFAQTSQVKNKVIAYYFHGSFRCPTCKKLEQYSKEAIDMNFKDALSSGELEFRPINIEDKGNEHYAQDYKLYTKSLILSFVKNGKEKEWKNLDKIWEYVGNKDKFLLYVKDGIASMLSKAR